MVLPSQQTAQVRHLLKNEEIVPAVYAGDLAIVVLSNIDMTHISLGYIASFRVIDTRTSS